MSRAAAVAPPRGRRPSGRLVALLVPLLVGTLAGPAAAQAPLDLLASHFGASRRPAIANQAWGAFSVMLLTEFDGRLLEPVEAPGTPDFLRYDGLDTSVGYNYVTLGGTYVITRNLENYISWLHTNTALTGAASAHLGWTGPKLGRGAQNALHDFRDVTRNFQPRHVTGYGLVGLDAELLVWPEGRWLALGGHASVVDRLHEEYAGKVAVVHRARQTKGHVTYVYGWLRPSGPAAVASRLEDTFWSVVASLEYADRYGISVGYDTGLLPDEPEVLMALFVGIQLGGGFWARGEFVNDLLGDKDRGPTGGGRLALAYTF